MTCLSTSANSIQRFKTLEQELTTIHRGYYSYSNAKFTTMKDKFLIACPIHGDFFMSPAKHKMGQGCKKCNNARRSLDRRSTTEEFIDKVKKVSPQYDYSKVVYVTAATKVTVTCSTHGDFYITPNKLLGGRHCKQCANETIGLALTKPVGQFIEQVQDKYGPKYTVITESYTNSKSPVSIICSRHGEFAITPDHLLNRSNCIGCYDCAKEHLRKCNSSTAAKFIAKASTVHNNQYTYDNTVYINSTLNVLITCKYHGDFVQSPSNHLAGKGCYICTTNWKYAPIPTTLYYLRITSPTGGTYYKIGITTKSITSRYSKELKLGYTITLLYSFLFLTGETAFCYEQQILRKFNALRNKRHIDFLWKSSGDTELFVSNILKA